jgi:glycosyltransferase involved in cell wall biosynthesis
MASITRMTLKEADRVVVLGECMRQAVIAYGAAQEKTTVIHNWVNEKVIRPLSPNENEFRKAHGFDGQFVVMYSGNMGIAHRFGDILEVARQLHGRFDIRFVFIGDGVRRKEIADFRSRHDLGNILILPYQDRSRLTESIGAGDVHFVSLREGFEGLVVPSKTYGIMAAGRPILYQGNAHGEIARMIIEKGFGEVVPEGEVNLLEMAILRLYNDRALADLLGKRARAALEEEYSMQRAMDAYEGIFKNAGGA